MYSETQQVKKLNNETESFTKDVYQALTDKFSVSEQQEIFFNIKNSLCDWRERRIQDKEKEVANNQEIIADEKKMLEELRGK